MYKKLWSGAAIALLAGGLSLASMGPANASGVFWTQTSCNHHSGIISYTYTSNTGSTVETAVSVGGTFSGSEGALLQAVVKKYQESEK
ncbi:hypothetical protein [Flexivirga sp. B27]